MHKFKQGDKVKVEGFWDEARVGKVVGLSHLQYLIPGSPEYIWDVSVDGYEYPFRESSMTLIPEREFEVGKKYKVKDGYMMAGWVGTVVAGGGDSAVAMLRFVETDYEADVWVRKDELEPVLEFKIDPREAVSAPKIEALRAEAEELNRRVTELSRLETEIRRAVEPALERVKELKSERYAVHRELGRVEAELGKAGQE